MTLLQAMLSIHGDTEAMQKLGTRLRAERLRRNLSQGHLAGLVGVALPTLRKIEAGTGTVEFRHVARTLGVLGYADALGELVPEAEPDLRLADLLAPRRQRATRRRQP